MVISNLYSCPTRRIVWNWKPVFFQQTTSKMPKLQFWVRPFVLDIIAGCLEHLGSWRPLVTHLRISGVFHWTVDQRTWEPLHMVFYVPGILCFVSSSSKLIGLLNWTSCVSHLGSPGNSKYLHPTMVTNIGTFQDTSQRYVIKVPLQVLLYESTASSYRSIYHNEWQVSSLGWLVVTVGGFLFRGIPDEIYKSPEICLEAQPTNQPTNPTAYQPHNHQTCNGETYSLALCGRT